MRLTVNGAQASVADDATVDAAIEIAGGTVGHRGVAVAVNGEVVPRGKWPHTRLSEDDRVEVLRAIGGG